MCLDQHLTSTHRNDLAAYRASPVRPAPWLARRDAMREGASDGDLRAIVSAAVDRKRAAHAGMFELAQRPNRAMVKIGG